VNTFEFISLQKKLGLKILETQSHNWVVTNDNLAISTPSLENSHPSKKELSEIFNKKVKMVTFTVDMDEKNSYEYMYEGNDYSLEVFNSKIRNQIRKGLKSCVVATPTLDDLMIQGLQINREILSIHKRDVEYLTNESLWYQYLKNMLNTKDVFVYGAYIKNILAGYIFFIKVNKKYYVYHPYTSRIYSKEAPMNALLFSAMNDFLKKDSYISVSYGLASFFEKQGLDHFKKGMLFTEKPITRVVAFAPLLSCLFNRFFFNILNVIAKIKRFEEKFKKYKILYDANQLYKRYVNDYTKI